MLRRIMGLPLQTCCLLIMLGVAATQAFAESSVIGKWTTIDDETGEPKSVVELYEKDGKLYGKVVDLLLKPDDTVCSKCSGELKDQPVVGMDIITGLSLDQGKYGGGDILDPAKGKTYACKLWLEDSDTLNVRGYLGIFYRTQTWTRMQE